jgi:hypothetical protein
MPYKTVYTEVEVDVDISDFDTDDLLEELENRGELPVSDTDSKILVETIYQKRRLGKDYEQELDLLLYNVLGRIV